MKTLLLAMAVAMLALPALATDDVEITIESTAIKADANLSDPMFATLWAMSTDGLELPILAIPDTYECPTE